MERSRSVNPADDPAPDHAALTAGVAATVGLVAGFVAAVVPWGAGPRAVLAAVVALAIVVAARSWLSVRSRERAAAEAGRLEVRAAVEEANRQRTGVEARDAVLATMPDGVVLFDGDGRVAYANAAVHDLLGRRFATAAELTPAALREAVGRVRRDGRTAECEVETSDHVLRTVAVPGGRPGWVVLLVHDVTAERRVDALRRDFVANASHELKTPVASIIALTDALGRAADEDPKALARFLGHLESETGRLSRLVGDLLDLSRLEAGAPERAPVRLDRVVGEEAERLRPRAERAGLDLTVALDDEVTVLGSARDLALMVNNLLDNAIRYTPGGGRVEVGVRAVDGWAELRVDDSGIGIPTRAIDRIFERFFRVDAARSRQTGGTGLGLSIVRHVVESHGGEVSVSSVLGAGSTFLVRFPLAPAP